MHRSRVLRGLSVALSLALVASPALAQDESEAVEDGGIHVDGWMGQIDAGEAENGATLEGSRLAMDGDALHVTTGPSVVYWHPSNTASGEYTVSATVTEPEYMNRSSHPHPYGLFIAGNDMGTDQMTLLYCTTYGNGNFIVRGFGPEPFRVSASRPESNDAINAAAGEGEPVTQELAISVRDGMVSCSVNGTVVGSYPVSDVVGDGMLASTDGVYGIRFGHNTEGTVSGLTVTNH